MYIIIGFAFSPLCSCIGNCVARSRVSLTSSVFSISSRQKLAPHWANSYFKALWLSTGDKAHFTHMEAASPFTLEYVASFICSLSVFVTQRYGYPPPHTLITQIQQPTLCHHSYVCVHICESFCVPWDERVFGKWKSWREQSRCSMFVYISAEDNTGVSKKCALSQG